MCQKRANVRASLPNDVPTCQRTLNAKWNFYNLFLNKKSCIILDIILIHMCVCIAHKNCIILHFCTSCHLKETCVEFCFLKLFCSLVFCFYTLQTTRVFSNFPLKQLKQNKESVWILGLSWIDLLEFEIRDSYKETLLRICFFPYLTIMFSSTVVPTIQKQSPEVFCKKRCWQKFREFHRKTSFLEFLINKYAAATLLKRDSNRLFSCEIFKIFENPFFEEQLTNHCFWQYSGFVINLQMMNAFLSNKIYGMHDVCFAK